MPKKKAKKKAEAPADFMYEKYDVRWLKGLRNAGEPHPEDHLIDEFEAKFGPIPLKADLIAEAEAMAKAKEKEE